jgi:DNA-binding transcriptional MerR regulator
MADDATEQHLTTAEAAEILRVAPYTLCHWRCEGIGPPFRRFGRAIRYTRADLQRWSDERQARFARAYRRREQPVEEVPAL